MIGWLGTAFRIGRLQSNHLSIELKWCIYASFRCVFSTKLFDEKAYLPAKTLKKRHLYQQTPLLINKNGVFFLKPLTGLLIRLNLSR